jgi:uncharacterized membrane protein
VNRPASPDDVLCIRRHQPTRLEGFVDASFAFAVTLLVISIGHVPASVPEMLHALRGLPAFAASFLLIARIWLAHRDWSRHYDIENSASIRLSLLLVFVVLIFVYPLRLLFSLFFAWISHGYLVDQELVLRSSQELRMAFEVYGIGFGSIAALMALLYRHALRASDAIGLSLRERLATRMHVAVWIALIAIAAFSVLCAALLPFDDTQPLLATFPGFVYAFTGISATLIRRHYAARIAAVPA